MKKLIVLLMALLLLLTGCVQKQTDYPAAIMVDGVVYLKSGAPMPAEIDESAIIGYTTSYTDSFPEKNGETNFSRELDLPYAKVEGGVAILCENEWYLCTPMEQNTEKFLCRLLVFHYSERKRSYSAAVFLCGQIYGILATLKI